MANPQMTPQLAAMLQGMGDAPKPSVGAGEAFASLSDVIDTSHLSVLNADGKTSVASVFGQAGGKLSSDPDVDHQLIVVVPFREKVKIRGLRFFAEAKAENASGPKMVKVWVDQPNITFEDAGKKAATDTLAVAAKDLSGTEQKVKFVKYQSVGSITIFIEKNQGDTEVTSLSKIEVVGCTLATFDVNKIKKSE